MAQPSTQLVEMADALSTSELDTYAKICGHVFPANTQRSDKIQWVARQYMRQPLESPPSPPWQVVGAHGRYYQSQ